jgi:hypothetical protein
MVKKMNCNMAGSGCGGAIYGLGFIGAAIYYIMHATSFWMGVLGFLKAMVWPAFLVFELMKYLKMWKLGEIFFILSMKLKLIAPCGMNCSLCYAFLREKNNCPGCRESDEKKALSCRRCIIKNCRELIKLNIKYCSDKCGKYPCQRLINLDKRYKNKYMMSMIENLEYIKGNGIRKFLINEERRWIKGNKLFCVHNKKRYELK